ncbi:EF-hand domain-containing protein [Planctomicrobium piriforme]|uniref:EF hand n=1 Tax=Planctomicrobium piriforme TaxID=1576369 RepID=A0A1I3JY86_9PLAN|nr:EF-hand domain-containing protein [Planctomicrobium piriforme]SFI65191.1 EF hand [Planctomicrobium piriforme]
MRHLMICLVMSVAFGVSYASQAWSQTPPPNATVLQEQFQLWDTDHNDKLSVEEFIKANTDSGSRQTFFRMDANADATLSQDEWLRQGKGISVPALSLFRGLDANADAALSLEEWISDSPATEQPQHSQTFLVFDLDQDHRLTLQEFLTIPGLVPQSQRGEFVDPIVLLANQEIARWKGAFHQSFAAANVQSQFQPVVSNAPDDRLLANWIRSPQPFQSQHWDLNSDQLIDPAELQTGLESAWGLLRFDGKTSRRPTGFVFNANYFASLDRNSDLQITLEEFLASHSPDPVKSTAVFQQLDADRDGKLTLAEVDLANFGWLDISNEFLRWDSDRNGAISADEFKANARAWEKNLAAYTIPAFDDNKDGVISLAEYRSTPFANPLFDWNGLKSDSDGDGFLAFSEFYPPGRLHLSLLARFFFDRMDANQDRLLGLDEYEFSVDLKRVPAAVVFQSLDRNDDDSLTLVEVFGESGHSTAPFFPRHAQLFKDLDADQSGAINLGEFSADSRCLIEAAKTEKWLQTSARPAFQFKDADHDGNLTQAEWLAGTTADKASQFSGEFVMCDDDRNGRLSFDEYLRLPSVATADRRSPVPDPVLEERIRVFALIAQGEADQPVAVVGTSLTQAQVGLTAQDAQEWDLDRNGKLSKIELNQGLDNAYGIRHAKGVRLRREQGQVFNLALFGFRDQDRDGALSLKEFLVEQGSPELATKSFQQLNQDQDGKLSLSELSRGDEMWIDVPSHFQRWDKDRNGLISPAEFSAQAREWEKPVVPMLFPGFDLDHDGSLSFSEYRSTLLANPLLDLLGPRTDRDHDGHLSLEEYRLDSTGFGKALSALFFNRLDLNRDHKLSLNEIQFKFDSSKVPVEILFQNLDANHDGRLAIEEALGPLMRESDTARFLLQVRELWRRSDSDEDGTLNTTELNASSDFRSAISLIGRLRGPLYESFQQKDRDKNGRLDLKELQEGVTPERKPALQREFKVLDFDSSQSLDLIEFSSLSSVSPRGQRIDVPDPILQACEQEVTAATARFQAADLDDDHLLNAEEWKAMSGGRWFTGYFAEIDLNKDKSIGPAELQRGLEGAYGMWAADGTLLRRPSGQILNWRTYFGDIDQNRDQFLTRAEVFPKFSKSAEENEALFRQVDVNSDDRLSVGEMSVHDQFLIDTLDKFFSFDPDLDGELSPSELAGKLAYWEQGYLSSLFPAYDVDQSGKLSFIEFRATPLGNQVLRWMEARDQDGDGRLSLSEFHPRSGLAFLGQSKLYFDRLDADKDGYLGLDEYEFPVDLQRVPSEIVFRSLDRNRDLKLSQEETFADSGQNQVSIFYPRHQRVFEELDRDHDGAVSLEEFSTKEGRLADAAATEKWLRASARPAFQAKDADHNEKLTQTEWLAGVAAERMPQLSGEFLMCDYDRDGQLSLMEYITLPSIATSTRRGPVPDPVVDERNRVLGVIAQAGTDQTVAAVREICSKEQTGLSAKETQGWDANRDGKLSDGELHRGLDVAYGLCTSNGVPLRRENGQVFNWALFGYRDLDKSGTLTLKEFLIEQSNSEQATLSFQQIDQDRDGQLTPAEMNPGDVYWIDVLSHFQRWDADHNGQLSPAELTSQARRWEQSTVATLFPAFDVDGDGSLSLMEYRGTLLANPLLDLISPRTDRSHDGRLSLDEYHPDATGFGKALSGLLFQRLDRNSDHRLTLDEVQFKFDPNQVPAEIAFLAFDSNRDGAVTLAELTSREKPGGSDAAAKRRHEEKLMQIEEAFHVADGDRSGSVSMVEYAKPGSPLAAAVAGKKPGVSKASSNTAASRYTRTSVGQSNAWNFRMIGLVFFNVLLLTGIGWFVWRST